jgi:hypothetical protein
MKPEEKLQYVPLYCMDFHQDWVVISTTLVPTVCSVILMCIFKLVLFILFQLMHTFIHFKNHQFTLILKALKNIFKNLQVFKNVFKCFKY